MGTVVVGMHGTPILYMCIVLVRISETVSEPNRENSRCPDVCERVGKKEYIQ